MVQKYVIDRKQFFLSFEIHSYVINVEYQLMNIQTADIQIKGEETIIDLMYAKISVQAKTD